MTVAETCRGTPETFADFRGRHMGAEILVCGCGESLNALTARPDCVVIGVNDVGRLFDPDYLVVVNPPAQFSPDRYRHVQQSKARAVFSQYPDLPLAYAPLVQFALGTHNGTDFSDPGVLHYTRNSPYVALCLAIYMGAKRIGLIGVDFTDNHFFAATGRHPLASSFGQIDREYRNLALACERIGIEIYNLSPVSRLTAFPRKILEEFTTQTSPKTSPRPAASLRIVSYATTPIAGVPAILARCIAARTQHTARCVWATNNYGNGVCFDGDLEWVVCPTQADAALAEADLVIAHNGKLDGRHRSVLAGKPVVTMAHNYMWNVDTGLVQAGFPGVVVGQYQATLPEFAGWGVVPNPVPLWEREFTPEPKGDTVRIAYTPSGRHESYPEGHRLYWHGKGYETTMRVLDALARRYPIEVIAVRDRQMSHAEALAAKRRAHIVIDECVTGSYHRNSLEGLACGCVVVNGVGLLPAIAAMLHHCAGDAPELPFVHASRATLEDVLDGLIAAGPKALVAAGRRNRAWMEVHWDFASQWRRFWQAAIEQAGKPTAPGGTRMRAQQRTQGFAQRHDPVSVTRRQSIGAEVPHAGLSVLIPFGGGQRLGALAATVASLRQSTAVDQVIVAEIGSEPVALPVAVRWAADHVFIPSLGPFDKARALNTGSPLARRAEILWCDGDLLFGGDFLARALHEFRAGAFDFLFPFSRIDYLDEVQSRDVRAGIRNPADCRAVRTLQPVRGGAVGGMGLVRAEFLRRHGGLIQGFLGWGGEDNAWVHKASLLGRVGTTRHPDQVAWHLFHPESGATGAQPWLSNPNYTRNVELLDRIQRIRSADELSRQFPPPKHAAAPWPATARIGFVTVAATEDAPAAALAAGWARRLDQAYGTTLPVVTTDLVGLATALSRLDSDVVVGFADGAAACSALATSLQARPAILVPGETDQNTGWPAAAGGGPWILARTEAQAAMWRQRGMVVWHRPWDDSEPVAGDALPVVIQPLSHLACGANTAAPEVPVCAAIPVWTYWEGIMPDWIASCLKTARRHVPSLRVLGPGEFDALRDCDRDIDLSGLHVAQRADFVRAFLLMRFGGMWIDADCILMRDLSPLLAQLDRFDAIAHRERQGAFSNAFLGVRPGSPVAARFYAAICVQLRARRPLSWTALGNEALTPILRDGPERFLELGTEQVQPVCWSRPEVYFHQADDTEHERDLNPQAWCYMLSQQNIIRHQNSTAAPLTAERSFFSFLVRRALADRTTPPETAPPLETVAEATSMAKASSAPAVLTEVFSRMRADHAAEGHESVSGPGSSLKQTTEVRWRLPLLLQHLDARVLLDAPCGDFHWMAHVQLGVESYIGVDLLGELIHLNRERHAAPGRVFLALNFLEDRLPRADVVLCRDCLGHLSSKDVFRALRAFVASGSRYLLTTTFPTRPANAEIRTGEWRPLNLRAAPFALPPPLHIINEKCSQSGGAFADKSLGLWRLPDLRLRGG